MPTDPFDVLVDIRRNRQQLLLELIRKGLNATPFDSEAMAFSASSLFPCEVDLVDTVW